MVKHVTPILQARMGSTRLPGKVLIEICGRTVLEHIITRVSRAKDLQPVVVATSVNLADDAIARECERLGVRVCRGSEDDVLARFYEAAKLYDTGHIMRICADNPLIDSALLDALVEYYRENDYSYVNHKNAPLGLGAEIFAFERLEEAYIKGNKPYHREHVTPYMYEDGIDCGALSTGLEYGGLRLTMDTPEDLELIRAVYARLYHDNPSFGLDDILALLRAWPELTAINRGITQKSYNSSG